MLSERLKELRKEKGYTQKQISELIGISQTTYAGYETGEHMPSLEILIRIADIFKVSLDYLTGRLIKMS